jgi:hypothetical protein
LILTLQNVQTYQILKMKMAMEQIKIGETTEKMPEAIVEITTEAEEDINLEDLLSKVIVGVIEEEEEDMVLKKSGVVQIKEDIQTQKMMEAMMKRELVKVGVEEVILSKAEEEGEVIKANLHIRTNKMTSDQGLQLLLSHKMHQW